MTSTDCLVPSRLCRSYDAPCKPRCFIQIGTCVGVPWLIITVSGLDDWMYWHWDFLSTIITAHNQRLILAPFLTGGVSCFAVDWIGFDLRIGHFVSFPYPMVNTLQLSIQLFNCLLNSFTNEWMNEFLVLLSTATALSSTALQMSPF
jgi:hypothetical protein